MSLRILIIEDDALTAAAFSAALADAGHKIVAVADSARAALADAGAARPDLALIDITLRDGRTGLAAARALRDDRVYTVLVSADANLKAKAEDVQALGYIPKPADATAVARVVDRLARSYAWTTRRRHVATAAAERFG